MIRVEFVLEFVEISLLLTMSKWQKREWIWSQSFFVETACLMKLLAFKNLLNLIILELRSVILYDRFHNYDLHNYYSFSWLVSFASFFECHRKEILQYARHCLRKTGCSRLNELELKQFIAPMIFHYEMKYFISLHRVGL